MRTLYFDVDGTILRRGTYDPKDLLADGKHKLSELAEAGDEAWDSVKGGVEAAWKSLNTAFSEAASKF